MFIFACCLHLITTNNLQQQQNIHHSKHREIGKPHARSSLCKWRCSFWFSLVSCIHYAILYTHIEIWWVFEETQTRIKNSIFRCAHTHLISLIFLAFLPSAITITILLRYAFEIPLAVPVFFFSLLLGWFLSIALCARQFLFFAGC